MASPKDAGSMVLVPSQVAAASTGFTLTMRYTAPLKGSLAGTVSIVVPTVGAPASGFSSPTAATVKVDKQTCASALVGATFPASTIAGFPGTVINVTVNCAAKQGFALSFSTVTVPRSARTYTFFTTANGLALGKQPVETVRPGPAASLVVAAPATTAAGTSFAVSVTAQDTYGNVATSFAETVALESSDVAATLPAPFAFTAADAGSHTFAGVGLATAGSQVVTATGTSVKGASAPISVAPGPASKLEVVAPQAATAGVGFGFDVIARDAFGNVATGYARKIALSSSDPAALFGPDTYTFSLADGGAHRFDDAAAFASAGDQTLVATDTLDASISGSAVVHVGAGTPAHIVLTGLPASTVAGALLSPVVTVEDDYGNPVPDYSGTVTFASSDPHATVPSPYGFVPSDGGSKAFTDELVLRTAGSQTVSVSDVTLPGTASVSVSVGAGSLDHLTLLPAATTVPAGSGAAFRAQGYDAYGNSLGDVTAGLTLSIAPDGTCDNVAHTCTSLVEDGGGSHHTVTGTNGAASGAATLTILPRVSACEPGPIHPLGPMWLTHLSGPVSEPVQSDALPAWVFVGDGSALRTITACGGASIGRFELDGQVAQRPTVVELGVHGSGIFSAFVTTTAGTLYRVNVDATTGAMTPGWSRDLRRRVFGTLICSGDSFAAAPVVQLRSESGPAFNATFPETDVVYVGTQDGCADTTRNRVVALSTDDGADLWTFNIDGTRKVGSVVSAPALDPAADRLYVGVSVPPESFGADSLFALDTKVGQLEWSVFAGDLLAAPAVEADRVYVVNRAGALRVYPSAGNGLGGNTPLWDPVSTASPGADVHLDFAVHDDSVVVVDSQGTLTRVGPDPSNGGRLHVVSMGAPMSIAGPMPATSRPLILDRGPLEVKVYVGTEYASAFQLGWTRNETPSEGCAGVPPRPLDVTQPFDSSSVVSGALVSDRYADGTTHVDVVFASSTGWVAKFATPWPLACEYVSLP
jgi:hypothetical protein